VYPCIRLGRGKFELTNHFIRIQQAGKNLSVLMSSKCVRKGIEIRQLFSLKMALNTHEKRFTFSKTITSLQKVKNTNHFVFLGFYFAAKNESLALGIVTRSLFVKYRQVG